MPLRDEGCCPDGFRCGGSVAVHSPAGDSKGGITAFNDMRQFELVSTEPLGEVTQGETSSGGGEGPF